MLVMSPRDSFHLMTMRMHWEVHQSCITKDPWIQRHIMTLKIEGEKEKEEKEDESFAEGFVNGEVVILDAYGDHGTGVAVFMALVQMDGNLILQDFLMNKDLDS